MSLELIQQQIATLLSDMLKEEGSDQVICPSTKLSEQGIDSFRHLKLYVEIERHFRIPLTERMFSENTTTSVNGLAVLIENLLLQPHMS